MKVLLFSEGMNLIKISGLGRAIMHQQKALSLNGIEYTLDPKDDYDVVHINTLGPKSKALAKKAKRNGKRVVYHAHSTEEDFRNSFIGSNLVAGIFKKWICSCYKQGDVIANPTEYSKSLIQGYGIKIPFMPYQTVLTLRCMSRRRGTVRLFVKNSVFLIRIRL